jgi:hypothetical protein
MIPTYRKDCALKDLCAWDLERDRRLIALLADGRVFAYWWYAYLLKGTMP